MTTPNKHRSTFVGSVADADRLIEHITEAADRTRKRLFDKNFDAMRLLRAIKFYQVGHHPIEDRKLNFIEQVNQTWTFLVALYATKKLLELHSDAEGFYLAPGAHASLPLDIMSAKAGYVGAETFAAVDPRNNGKINADLKKLASRQEEHRYIFFMSPLFPESARQKKFERGEIQVWSIDF
ncbi:MAG: hypothetical protein KGH84_01315 [Paracoccaceae bacterium]|nr:hypothetical protein [Paracoccaceae bacterium]